jgi:hypothetical protein
MAMFELFNRPKHVALFSHGQYNECSMHGTFSKKSSSPKGFANKATPETANLFLLEENTDDFHSPCRPSNYLEMRVQ